MTGVVVSGRKTNCSVSAMGLVVMNDTSPETTSTPQARSRKRLWICLLICLGGLFLAGGSAYHFWWRKHAFFSTWQNWEATQQQLIREDRPDRHRPWRLSDFEKGIVGWPSKTIEQPRPHSQGGAHREIHYWFSDRFVIIIGVDDSDRDPLILHHGHYYW